uniref:Uncharacterized protein n=1 Tax=Alexandrium catenella TaxID=2925 RepID=A0A7S1LP41_ALECA
MQRSPELARAVVAMAESREEVVQRLVGLDDAFEYRIILKRTGRDSDFWSVHGQHMQVIVFLQGSFAVKTPQEMCVGGAHNCLSHLLNIFHLHGFCLEGAPVSDVLAQESSPIRSMQLSMKLRVPRSFALLHPSAL